MHWKDIDLVEVLGSAAWSVCKKIRESVGILQFAIRVENVFVQTHICDTTKRTIGKRQVPYVRRESISKMQWR